MVYSIECIRKSPFSHFERIAQNGNSQKYQSGFFFVAIFSTSLGKLMEEKKNKGHIKVMETSTLCHLGKHSM